MGKFVLDLGEGANTLFFSFRNTLVTDVQTGEIVNLDEKGSKEIVYGGRYFLFIELGIVADRINEQPDDYSFSFSPNISISHGDMKCDSVYCINFTGDNVEIYHE